MEDYYDLGTYKRTVTTNSSEAQAWFDRGLLWRYAFNHEEAIQCFRNAIDHDPSCAMAHWGVAYAAGPYYNKPWDDFTTDDRLKTLAQARQAMASARWLASEAAPLEQALIQALDHRYPSDQLPDIDGLRTWEDDYAAAMRNVYSEFPADLDICVLFAEAMMNRTPWQLWDLSSGRPAPGADTVEVVAVLDHALQLMESPGTVLHPGVLHLYIHALEMSPHPEQALRAADALRELAPDAGHFCHMPSHIDVQCGDYHAALVANTRAIEADRKFLEREGPYNFYTHARCHDYHLKLYAAMFLGQYRPALEAVEEMIATVPEALLRQATPPMADWLEGFVAMKPHVLVRFGKWHEILDEPLPHDPGLYAVTTAMLHYAKGVAHAVLGATADAEAQWDRFADARGRVPATRKFFNNSYRDLLAVAAEMLRGEIEYRKGNHESGYAHLRTAVKLSDELPYDEPWGWMQPPRHALGALLLEQGRLDEATAVYEIDLGLDRSARHTSAHPDNVWSLLGYVECLQRLRRHADAATMQRRLDLAIARADPEIRSSCFCRAEGVTPQYTSD